MKKYLFIAAVLASALLLPNKGAAAPATHVYLNDQELALTDTKQVMIVQNSVMVPIRVIVEELGYKVDWNGKTNLVTITNSAKTIKLTIGNANAAVDDHTINLPVAPLTQNNTAYVPLRFVGEQMGLQVAWDNRTKSVYLVSQHSQDDSAAQPGSPGAGSDNPQAGSGATGPQQTAETAALQSLDFMNGKLILAVDGQIKPVASTLSGPDRIVIDLPNTAFDPSFSTDYALDGTQTGEVPVAGYPNVSKVEFTLLQNNPSTVRVVIDLNASQTFSLQQNGNLITVDLNAGSAASSSSSPTVLGLDVSHHNGAVDWNQVAANGYSFVFIKASEGQSFRDPEFAANLSGAKASRLWVGAYHFLDAATPDNARLEADNFVETLQEAGGIDMLDLPPVLDYEDNPGKLATDQINAVAKAFIDEFTSLTGYRLMIYTGNVFAANFDSSFAAYQLWIARYSSQEPYPVQAWNSWTIWQYTQTGSVPGITGNVDLDQFRGTLDEFYALLNP